MQQQIDVILLCGGKGTRFREVTQDKVPKSLYKINGHELIKLTIANLDFSYIHSLVFAVDHHAESLKEWVIAQEFPCPVYFSYQTQEGIFGAVNAALEYVTKDIFIVCNTDELRDGLSLKKALTVHYQAKKSATMVTTFSDHLFYHRVVVTSDDGTITSTELKNPEYQDRNEIVKQINTGLLIFHKDCVKSFSAVYGNDWSSLIDPLVRKRSIGAALDPNIRYFNIGTKQELEQAHMYLNDVNDGH